MRSCEFLFVQSFSTLLSQIFRCLVLLPDFLHRRQRVAASKAPDAFQCFDDGPVFDPPARASRQEALNKYFGQFRFLKAPPDFAFVQFLQPGPGVLVLLAGGNFGLCKADLGGRRLVHRGGDLSGRKVLKLK